MTDFIPQKRMTASEIMDIFLPSIKKGDLSIVNDDEESTDIKIMDSRLHLLINHVGFRHESYISVYKNKQYSILILDENKRIMDIVFAIYELDVTFPFM